MSSPGLARPSPFGRRSLVTLGILLTGVLAFVQLGLAPRDLLPGDGLLPTWDDLGLLREFLSRAFTPALTYESADVPSGAPPLLLKALGGAHRTVAYAAMAMSLSIVFGLPLGFVASRAWWRTDPARAPRRADTLAHALYAGARLLIGFMRSIHELLWAVLLLAAIGRSNFAAVMAIAIPYAGTLAKVFSEILDEAPTDTALALRMAGASRLQVFLFGLFPRALPDLSAYAFYRFECAMRSAAVIGFFGPETLGKFIGASWKEAHYGEVWTYLYALIALILGMEWWSGRLRRTVVA